MMLLMTVSSSFTMSETTPKTFPIGVILRKSCNRQFLYDVDGNVIRGVNGDPLNVFKPEMAAKFDDGSLRIIRVISPGYRYFVQRQAQQDRFMEEREKGAPIEYRTYHLYVDEDTDYRWFVNRDIRIFHRW